MKLYNYTKLDDKVLERFLYRAAKAVGSVRIQKVIIRVTTSSRYMSGYMSGYSWVYADWLTKGKQKIGTFETEGLIELHIPVLSNYHDSLELAESVYKTAAHEWRHIRDYQKNIRFDSHKKHWKNRSHERRAMGSASRAEKIKDKDTRIQDAIIDLALDIESARSKK